MLPKHFLAASKQATRTNKLNTTTEVILQAVRKRKIIKTTTNTNKNKTKTNNTPEVTSCKNNREKTEKKEEKNHLLLFFLAKFHMV